MILAAFLLAAAAAAHPESAFAVRIVKLSGDPGSAASREHVRFCRDLGFNALWVESSEAGVWTKGAAPDAPRLDPDFVRLARGCKRRGMEVWVALRPMDDDGGRFVFTDPDRERRLLAFASLLHEQAEVRRFVLDLDDAPTQLTELADVFAYGASSAPAHLALARRLASSLPADASLSLFAAASCDARLGDGGGPYAQPFLAGLAGLPPALSLVWTGPAVLSRTITRAELDAARARLGGRAIVLYDHFPTDEEAGVDDAMALVLGTLRGREPSIRDAVSGYVACPVPPVAGARLSLLASASFLLAPRAYESEAATREAVARLAGRDRDAAKALETQQLEWGGALAGRNFWPPSLMNPGLAAGRMHDPAFVDSFTWTVDRYPGRMAALRRLADAPFREELLRMMRRRLAIARAMPPTIDYLTSLRQGDAAGAAAALARIDALRRSWSGDPDARRTLELFLAAATVPAAVETR